MTPQRPRPIGMEVLRRARVPVRWHARFVVQGRSRRKGARRVPDGGDIGSDNACRVVEDGRTLYERAGFTTCGPFGDYPDSANSVFMTLALSTAGTT